MNSNLVRAPFAKTFSCFEKRAWKARIPPSRCVLSHIQAQGTLAEFERAQVFLDDADGEVLADLDSGDEAPNDETDMDDDAEAAEPGGVPDMSLHCFRGHAGPARG